jgi:glycine/D-amino acid oxidase-like deaminating enzyme
VVLTEHHMAGLEALEADQIYYQQLADAVAQCFPVLRDVVVIQERRGLPTITPDGQYLVSAVDSVQGLVIVSGCQVGGIWASPGALAPSMVSRRAARGRRAEGWGDAAAARGGKGGFGILIRQQRYTLKRLATGDQYTYDTPELIGTLQHA